MAEEGEASGSRKKLRTTPPRPQSLLPVRRIKRIARLISSDDETEGSSGQGAPDAGAEEEDQEESQGNGEHSKADGDEFAEEESLGSSTGGVDEEGSPEPASASPFARTGDSSVADVTVADADALECGVCFFALRPPIFQCELGHVVCSACRDKLEATGNCHVCGVATRGYRRCHAMERLVDSILVPCPYAAHGCVATPAYHGREDHRQACPHAPCHCPGETCGFVGSATALLDHFAGAHSWPCTTKVRAGEAFRVRLRLRDGFNFLADDGGGADGGTSGSAPRLFLLNVTRERLGRAISVICIDPHATVAAAAGSAVHPVSTRCALVFSRYGGGSLCRSHYQRSDFQVACTDLAHGLPSPDGYFQFLVPDSVLGDDDTENAIKVEASIAIS